MKKKETKLESYNLTVQQGNQNNLRELEQEYVDNKIAKMDEYIEQRKQEITNELIEYAENHTEAIKWDREGCPIAYGIKVKPAVISNYFLKSICPIGSTEPIYNAEKLALVFEYYNYLIAEINDKIGNYPSSLTSFCKLAGITLNTLRQLRVGSDLNMRVIVEKIYDQIGDENIAMGQVGAAKERTTLFKLKSQNELTEAVTPNVNINITEKVDRKAISEKLNRYRNFIDKKN